MNSLYGKGPHVYIGYAPPDRAFALRLAHDLKARRVPAWLDQFGTETTWLARELERQAKALSARRYLLVLSPAAVDSTSMMVRDAIALRDNCGIKIVTILSEDCEVPAALRGTPCFDFRGEYTPAFERLVSGIGGRPSARKSR